MWRFWLGLVAGVALSACSSSDEADGNDVGADPLPPLSSVRLTDEVRLVPDNPRSAMPGDQRAFIPEELEQMLADGLDRYHEEPGQAHVTRTLETGPDAAPSESPELMVRFVHLADLQLADDESPTRLANFDSPAATSAAFRPQESHLCRMLEAMVRTINGVNAMQPVDFVLLGGDNADSAQSNELDWVLTTLNGGAVECDSGDDDDPVPGQLNDGKDRFTARGLDVPWYWVTGNHDVLVQGNLPVSDGKRAEVLGDRAIGGTRNWSEPGGPVFTGPVVIDTERSLLSAGDLIDRVAASGDGHGLGTVDSASGKASYTFDVPGTPLRFLVLDTATVTGGSDGLIRNGEWSDLIRPALDAAVSDGKWISLVSHHAASSLGDGSGLGGETQPDAMTEQEWLDAVAQYPNVLFSFVGHSHEHRVTELTGGNGTHHWWEVMTSALVDYPHQSRVIEIWRHGDSLVQLRATNLDFATDGDVVAERGRALGVLDYVSGWMPDGNPAPEGENVELWISAPTSN